MLEGSCHCGGVTWRFDGAPDAATACNCTICRRYGALWIYGHEGDDVHLHGETQTYQRGQALTYERCPKCGCVAAWRGLHLEDDGRRRMAVNVRLAEPAAVAHLLIDHFDGLHTFDDLPRDGKTVADYWF